MATTPDDGTPEPFEDAPTNLDPAGTIPEQSEPVPASERKTGTYAGSAEFVAGREAGYEAGFKAGVERAITALRTELKRAQCTDEEIARVVQRIRVGTSRKR
jgi:hypothetical protein